MFKTIIHYFIKGHRIRITAILCLIVIYVSAQSVLPSPQNPADPSVQSGRKRVEMIYSRSLNKRPNFEPLVLLDSVVLFHDGAYMYCDSAYLYENSNTFEAFSNIVVEQGDTLFLYGDYLHYDGNTMLLQVRNNVRLENNNVTLFTDSLNYDRVVNLGYYFDGGMLVDEENELTSFWGQYEPDIKIATFKDSVKLVNLKFTLYSDTLRYNTDTKIATILGPSTIVSDSGVIHTKRGWYNTQTEETTLYDRSTIENLGGDRILIGDTVYYDKTRGFGEVFGNMFMQDTVKKVILRGHYGYFDDLNDYAMATDSASAIEYSQGDSLYLHADTLKLITVTLGGRLDMELRQSVPADSIQQVSDSLQSDMADFSPADEFSFEAVDLNIDSLNITVADEQLEDIETYRLIKAYYGVRFYRSDIQGVCDSMQYSTRDSVLYMYREPVLWNESQQMHGDTIEIHMNDSTIDHVHMKNYCFAIQQFDSLHFNQLKGRDLKAYFEEGEARYILVEGNAESIFYPEEDDGTLTGMNKTESGFLSINIRNRKIEKLKIWPNPKGNMTPIPELLPEQLRLKDFQWFDYLRPTDKDDIFRKVQKKQEAIRPKRSDKFRQEE